MKYIHEETRFIGKYSNLVFKAIYMSINPYKYKFLLSIFFGFLGRSLLLGNANIIGKWADSLCANSVYCQNKNGLFANFDNTDFFILLLTISLLGLIFLTAFRVSISRLGTYSVARLYDETTIRVSRFPMSFFDTNPVGRIITRFSSDYNAVFRMAGGPLGEFLSIIFDIMLFFILIVVASPFYLPIVIFSLIINYIVYKLNQNHLRRLRREHSLSRSPVLAHFAETTQGSNVIRFFGKQVTFINYFLQKFDYYISQKNKTNITANFFSLQMSCINILILGLTAFIGLWFVHKELVTIGSLGVAFTFISMTSSTIQVFFEWASSVEDALTGTERMSEYLFKEIEQGAQLPCGAEFPTGHAKVLSPRTVLQPLGNDMVTYNTNDQKFAVQVLNLCLRYQQNHPFVLNNVSFNVKRGEKIGIIGKTGSGKSSLIQALFHLYPLENGKIIIEGFEANLNTNHLELKPPFISLESFRKKMFLLTQVPVLYVGSFRENLTNDKSISDETILSVAKIVGLEKMILSHHDKLDMQIQENGANFSSGEKQLLCMARCLLQNPSIILMDEATSSVDPETEELLVNSTKLFLKGKTQIIVAHRLSTIEDCDQIIWLDAGKIIMADKPEIVLPIFKEFGKK